MKDKYLDLYTYWKSRSSKEGFSNKQFNETFSRYVDQREHDPMTIALGAKITYKTLIKERNEFQTIQYEIENAYWV